MYNIASLIASLEFWYAKKFIKLDKHYTFFLDLNGEPGSFAIKYLGKYDGVIVEFTDIKITENNQLNFKYQVISNVNNVNVDSKKFIRFTSHVMRNILFSALDYQKKELNENRELDFVESDSERAFYEEITPVLEERVPDRKPRKKTLRTNKGIHSKVQQFAPSRRAGNKSKRGYKSN